MKVYLDTCSLHRPLDKKSSLRVALEAEAIVGVLEMCERGGLTLISSEVLRMEVECNPDPLNKAFLLGTLEQAPIVAEAGERVLERALELEQRGFKAFDALHIASAENIQADRFCTCDDRLLKRCRKQLDLTVKVVSPLELAEEVSP